MMTLYVALHLKLNTTYSVITLWGVWGENLTDSLLVSDTSLKFYSFLKTR